MTRVARTLQTFALGVGLFAGTLGLAPSAFAAGDQQAAATPSETTATFGSWTVRCRPTGDAATDKLCEMVQPIKAGNNQGVIANLALGRLPGDTDLRMVVQLPLGVSLSSEVDITLPDGAAAKAQFETCYPNLCVAQATVSDDLLKAFKADDALTIGFKDRAKKDVSVKASLQGFTAAYGAMTADK